MDIKKAYFMSTNSIIGNYSKLANGKNKPNAEQSIVEFFKFVVLNKMYECLDTNEKNIDLIDCLIYTISLMLDNVKLSMKDFFDFLDKNIKPENNQIDNFLYSICPENELFDLYNKKFGIGKKTLSTSIEIGLLTNKEVFLALNNFAGYISSYSNEIGSQLKNLLNIILAGRDKQLLNMFKTILNDKQVDDFNVQDYLAAILLDMPDEFLEKYDALVEKYEKEIKTLTENSSKATSKEDKLEQLKKFKEQTKGIFDRIVGQKEQLNAIMHVLYNAYLGLNNPDGPRASMLLTGPTGVGKTETAFAISKSLFNKDPFVIDLAVYNGSHQLSTLIGSPPGYVGYSDKPAFLEYIKKNAGKGGVLLFDEFDKANPQVLNIFMHMLDKGEVQSAKGESYSVKDFIIITTSNISEKVSRTIGFGAEEQSIKNAISSNAVGNIPPELIARFDLVLAYQSLSKEEKIELAKRKMDVICDKIKRVNDFLNVSIKYNDKVLEDLALTVNDSMGIRELFRNINNLATQKLVDYIMENDQFTDLVIQIKSINDIIVKSKTPKKTKNISSTSKKLKNIENVKQ